MLAGVVKGLRLTFKVEIVKSELIDLDKPNIYSLWHGEQFITIMLLSKLLKIPIGGIVSTSKDGDILAACMESLDYRTIRGSSSKQGARALLQIIKMTNQGCATGFAVDGPRGPRKIIKPGIIYLAQKTGQQIVPVTYEISKKYIFKKAWDKFEVPLPWQKIIFKLGDPISVPAKTSKEQIEEMAKFLAQEMDKL